jgi:hypothetical protein
MDPTIVLNKRVEVIAVFKKEVDNSQICMPAKMRFEGREVTFKVLGLRHPTSQGRRMIHVFDVSDNVNDYRLEFDAEGLTWTLVSMLEGSHAAGH